MVADRTVGDRWLVTQGLKPGDRLIVEGAARVAPGQLVTPTEVKLGAAGVAAPAAVAAERE